MESETIFKYLYIIYLCINELIYIIYVFFNLLGITYIKIPIFFQMSIL